MKAFLLSSSPALLLPALWVQVDVLFVLLLVGAQHAPRAFPRAKRARGDGPTVYGDSTGRGDVPALGRGGLCFGVLIVTFRSPLARGPCVLPEEATRVAQALWDAGDGGGSLRDAARKSWSFVKHQGRVSGRGKIP